MDLTSTFAALAFLFSISAYVPYVKSVIEGSAQPTISTWISWGLMDIALLAGIIAAGEMAWQITAYVIGVGFVVSTSLYKGATMGWTRLDLICLTIVVIAIIIWTTSGSPNIAIILSLVAITTGTVPMMVNLWKDPAREPLLPWLLITAGGTFGVLAIQSWTIAAALTPVYFLFLQIATVFLISRKLRSASASA